MAGSHSSLLLVIPRGPISQATSQLPTSGYSGWKVCRRFTPGEPSPVDWISHLSCKRPRPLFNGESFPGHSQVTMKIRRIRRANRAAVLNSRMETDKSRASNAILSALHVGSCVLGPRSGSFIALCGRGSPFWIVLGSRGIVLAHVLKRHQGRAISYERRSHIAPWIFPTRVFDRPFFT